MHRGKFLFLLQIITLGNRNLFREVTGSTAIQYTHNDSIL